MDTYCTPLQASQNPLEETIPEGNNSHLVDRLITCNVESQADASFSRDHKPKKIGNYWDLCFAKKQQCILCYIVILYYIMFTKIDLVATSQNL